MFSRLKSALTPLSSSSLFAKALIRATAIGFGSTALALGFSSPSEAITVCLDTGYVAGASCGTLLASPNPPGSPIDEIDFLGTATAGATDFFNFEIDANNPTLTFNVIELEGDNGSVPGATTAFTFTLFDAFDGAGSSLGTCTASAGGECDFLASGTFATLSDFSVTVTGSGALPAVYTAQVTAFYPTTTVPGPLPILGAGVAFGFSRKLRRRIASAKA